MTIISLETPAETAARIGSRVRHARLAQNLTQAELAGRAGIAVGAVRNLESAGRSTLITCMRCLHALGVVDDLAALLNPPAPTSIAQLARQEQVATRQRARRRAAP
ncbi:MAG: helix-turn-helix transcriptional regulator [Burkholderiales bacterium]|nr:helix-turn-helix transcriptional regulator [Burkholderiales bacterium]